MASQSHRFVPTDQTPFEAYRGNAAKDLPFSNHSDKRPFSGGPKADFPLHARWLSDDDQRVCFHGKVIARIRGHRNKKSAAPQARLGDSALFYSWCIAHFKRYALYDVF